MRFYEYEAREIVERAGIPVTDYGFTRDRPRRRADRGAHRRAGGHQVAGADGRADEGGRRPVRRHAGRGRAPRARTCSSSRSTGTCRAACSSTRAPRSSQEYYAGVVWDGIRKRPVMLFSDMGGIDIEEVAEAHPDHVGRGHFSTILPLSDFRAKEVIASVGVTGSRLNRLVPIVTRLARAVRRARHDARGDQPARRARGRLVRRRSTRTWTWRTRPAARQKELLEELGVGDEETRQAREPTPFELAGEAVDAQDHRGVAGNVTEFDGDLGLVIGAGGGSLTLFDAVRAHGGRPANYCEIGGNPSVAKACGLAKLVLQKPGVDKIAVMMSIVSNTRVDIVARGVIKACLELGLRPGREDRDLPHPGRVGGRGLQDPRAVRRRVRRPLGVDARGGAARRREDPGGGGMSILIDETRRSSSRASPAARP